MQATHGGNLRAANSRHRRGRSQRTTSLQEGSGSVAHSFSAEGSSLEGFHIGSTNEHSLGGERTEACGADAQGGRALAVS
jgi:hypothetical protein